MVATTECWLSVDGDAHLQIPLAAIEGTDDMAEYAVRLAAYNRDCQGPGAGPVVMGQKPS